MIEKWFKILLKKAYDAGFKDGNGYDWGTGPEYGDFDAWYESEDFLS